MGLSQNSILDQIYQLSDGTILKFHTMTNKNNMQTFIVAPVPHSYKKFKIAVFDGEDDSYNIYKNCNIVFIDDEEYRNKIKDVFGKFPDFDCYFAKIVESGGTSYSSAIVETKVPIDMSSIRLIDWQDFDDIVKRESETRKKEKTTDIENAKSLKAYNAIIQSVRLLITCDLTIDSKRVSYRDPALGSKASYESYYSYDSETKTEEYGIEELIKVFDFCKECYRFIEDDAIIEKSISYKNSLSTLLKDKKTQDIDEAVFCNKRFAAILRDRYISFLKYLLNNNINPLEENLRYTRTWERNGFGDDKKYTLIVSEPIMEVGNGLLNYITKAIGQEEGIKFDNDVDNLLRDLDKHKMSK